MVSTRNHPKNFPSPTLSPPKSSPSSRDSRPSKAWAHTPSNLALLWLSISVPLVIWDTTYIFLRPHSLPGGSWHDPVFTLYNVYARVDYMYGWPAYDRRDGFPAAQSAINAIETVIYSFYLYIMYQHGRSSRSQGRAAPSKNSLGWLGQSRTLSGSWAALAPLICFSGALMTTSKTVLYLLMEYYCGFANVGHNSWRDLIVVYVVLDGLWVVFPAYVTYMCWVEIAQGLKVAANSPAFDSRILTIKDE